jgi:hypothetical protein
MSKVASFLSRLQVEHQNFDPRRSEPLRNVSGPKTVRVHQDGNFHDCARMQAPTCAFGNDSTFSITKEGSAFCLGRDED